MLISADMDRARISRTTLVKIEKGERGLAIGYYSAVLFATGMSEGLREIIQTPESTTLGFSFGRTNAAEGSQHENERRE